MTCAEADELATQAFMGLASSAQQSRLEAHVQSCSACSAAAEMIRAAQNIPAHEFDTSSHLGLDEKEWPWERALPICGAAGDSIFFHVKTVHGSKSNFSKASRPVFIHRYRRADDFVIVGATMTNNRAEAEKRAAEAKKENQVGFMVRGRRKFIPNRGQ
jgi:ectoine hydroxylase-related dioxygenase (phytanoyl-CoA dioxygenase family)